VGKNDEKENGTGNFIGGKTTHQTLQKVTVLQKRGVRQHMILASGKE